MASLSDSPPSIKTTKVEAYLPVDSVADSSENGGMAKKPVWSKPSDTVIAEVGAVMGAESWPALSESARASPKSSTDSLKALSHGSPVVLQGTAVGSSSLQKEVEVNTDVSIPNPTPNHVAPTRQRSMKRAGGGTSSQSTVPTNDSLYQTPPTPSVVIEAAHQKESSNRDNTHRDKDAGQRGGSFGGSEQRGSFRKSNSGSQPRGDSSYNGGRRDQERGTQQWGNPHRSHAPQQRVGSRPYMRGPAPNAPFIPSPTPHVAMTPYGTPIVYPEGPSHVYYVPGPHPDAFRPMYTFPFTPMFFPMQDPQLASKILNQINYYFSNENLVKDIYLRKNMDAEGWVSINLIAGFKKVKELTDNVQLIMDAIQTSNVVEVQGDKVRRKSDWFKWLMPSVVAQTGQKSTQDMLAAQFNSATLN